MDVSPAGGTNEQPPMTGFAGRGEASLEYAAMDKHDTSSDISKQDAAFSPIAWRRRGLWLLEQTLLPAEETWIECPDA